MYLFIYGDYDEGSAFEIIDGFSKHYALQNFYEYVGGHHGIDKDLFYDMIRNISFDKAVDVFNALCPYYEIKKVYSDLSEVWMKGGDSE